MMRLRSTFDDREMRLARQEHRNAEQAARVAEAAPVATTRLAETAAALNGVAFRRSLRDRPSETALPEDGVAREPGRKDFAGSSRSPARIATPRTAGSGNRSVVPPPAAPGSVLAEAVGDGAMGVQRSPRPVRISVKSAAPLPRVDESRASPKARNGGGDQEGGSGASDGRRGAALMPQGPRFVVSNGMLARVAAPTMRFAAVGIGADDQASSATVAERDGPAGSVTAAARSVASGQSKIPQLLTRHGIADRRVAPVSEGRSGREAQPGSSIGNAGTFGPLATPAGSGRDQPSSPDDHGSGPNGSATARGGPVGGDVYLDGALMGRWIARALAMQAGRPPNGGAAFDPLRNVYPAGAMIGG